jgi:hypothetical protein
MAVTLKISNVHENGLELVRRLRGVNSPGKKKLLDALKNSNWKEVYEELLYRIELYTTAKVLNYNRYDLNLILASIRQNDSKINLKTIVNSLIKKYILNDDNDLLKKRAIEKLSNLLIDTYGFGPEMPEEKVQQLINKKSVVLPNVPRPKTKPGDTYGKLAYIFDGKWAGLIGLVHSTNSSNERNFICPGTDIYYSGKYEIAGIANDNEMLLFDGTKEEAKLYNSKVLKDVEWLADFKYRVNLYPKPFINEYNINQPKPEVKKLPKDFQTEIKTIIKNALHEKSDALDIWIINSKYDKAGIAVEIDVMSDNGLQIEVNTYERGDRVDHGFEDIELQIKRVSEPYKLKYQPKIKEILEKIKILGFEAQGWMDYTEKGHIYLEFLVKPKLINLNESASLLDSTFLKLAEIPEELDTFIDAITQKKYKDFKKVANAGKKGDWETVYMFVFSNLDKLVKDQIIMFTNNSNFVTISGFIKLNKKFNFGVKMMTFTQLKRLLEDNKINY